MTKRRPHVVLAGPNGAGKSTAAPALLGRLGVTEFVNADTIARGLSAFSPEHAAIEAGRIMLARLRHLAAQRRNFAFETTLASRTFAPRLVEWVQEGYAFHLNQTARHSYTQAASCEISVGVERATCSAATAAVISGA